jgi:predicted RNase H-like HicB family nuclease
MMRYTAIFEATKTGFSAYVPDLPGVAAAGATIDEARARLKTAVAWQLEALVMDGDPIPLPTTIAEPLEVDPGAT